MPFAISLLSAARIGFASPLASRLSGRTRDRAYALLEKDLMARAAPIAPYMVSNARILVSARVGCFTYEPVYGTDLAALCLR